MSSKLRGKAEASLLMKQVESKYRKEADTVPLYMSNSPPSANYAAQVHCYEA